VVSTFSFGGMRQEAEQEPEGIVDRIFRGLSEPRIDTNRPENLQRIIEAIAHQSFPADVMRIFLERIEQRTLQMQRHGSFYTRRTLFQRIAREDSALSARTLPGGFQRPDYRIWRGDQAGAASCWNDDDTMSEVIGNVLNEHLHDIARAARAGDNFDLERIAVGRPIGRGWLTTSGAPASQRAAYWSEGLKRFTVRIRPDGTGGWYVLTAHPEL
jgi:hypothetical protein